ncbi:sugar MFS transporter [Haladaptatus pallidirubidus]|uniref:MFS transporter n=1 Tax=Haladaptatus pallidirubidus TaxID=1008152 RepID=UPI0035EBD188
MEGTLFFWLPYYASSYFQQDTANILLSTFLLAYFPGRMAYGILIDHLGELGLLFVGCICSLPLLYITFLRPQPAIMFASVFGLGILISGLYPTFSALGVEIAPEYSGPVNALSTAAMSIGIAIVPVIVGVITGLYSIQISMWLLPAQFLLLLIVLIVLLVARSHSATGIFSQ